MSVLDIVGQKVRWQFYYSFSCFLRKAANHSLHGRRVEAGLSKFLKLLGIDLRVAYCCIGLLWHSVF